MSKYILSSTLNLDEKTKLFIELGIWSLYVNINTEEYFVLTKDEGVKKVGIEGQLENIEQNKIKPIELTQVFFEDSDLLLKK